MAKPGRVPCINPRCRRTGSAERYGAGSEIICGPCFRALPVSLRRRWRAYHARMRRVDRAIHRRAARGHLPPALAGKMEEAFARAGTRLWQAIKTSFSGGERPAGLEAFLEEVGL